jgi:hypothetical protein
MYSGMKRIGDRAAKNSSGQPSSFIFQKKAFQLMNKMTLLEAWLKAQRN